MKLTVTTHSAPLRQAFSISRGSKTEAVTVRVSLGDAEHRGRGECVPYPRYGETPDTVAAAIERHRGALEAGISREELQELMPAGAARCAVDCALWDIEAKRSGIPVWQRAGLPEPKPVETAITVSLDTPEAMASAAASAGGSLLKIKLGGTEDLARLEAVHAARPDARLVLDGNEGLDPKGFPALAKSAALLGGILIEQPFPAGGDKALQTYAGLLSVCADESAHTSADIDRLARLYDAVNIKLDKAGGLTEALRMAREARRAGMGVMVGCMVAGSLSMAPAVLLAGLADLADLDGPIWLAGDIADGLVYRHGQVHPPVPALWG